MYCQLPAITFTIDGSGVNWVSLNSETGIEVSNSNALEFGNAIEKLCQMMLYVINMAGMQKDGLRKIS